MRWRDLQIPKKPRWLAIASMVNLWVMLFAIIGFFVQITGLLPDWFPFFAVFMVSVALYAIVPDRVISFYRNRAASRAKAGRCPNCNYSLTGLPVGSACPECGGGGGKAAGSPKP